MLKSKTFTTRFVPASRPGAGPGGKLLVVLHGLGDSLQGFTWLPADLKIPELSYLLVNAPDPYYGGFSWFDFPVDPVPGILRSRVLLASLLDEIVEQGYRAEDVFLFGFSQGCLMAMDAGLRSDLPLGGVIGVSGWVAFIEEYPEALTPAARARKYLVTHGLQDPLLPFEVTAAQCRQLRELGLDLEFRPYDKAHTMLPDEVRDIRAWLTARLG